MAKTNKTLGQEDVESRDGGTRKQTKLDDNPGRKLKLCEERRRRWRHSWRLAMGDDMGTLPVFPCSELTHLPIAARHSPPVDDSIFAGSTTSRIFSNTLIQDKTSSSRGTRSIISIHDSNPDLSTREVAIRLLFVRLSNICDLELAGRPTKKMKIGDVPQGSHFSWLGLALRRLGTDWPTNPKYASV
jgi:hypothetical protein